MSTQFDREITQLLYKQAPSVSVSQFFMVPICYYYFSNLLPHGPLGIWAAANLLFATALLFTWFFYRKHDSQYSTKTWLAFYTTLVVLQETGLGMLGPLSILLADDTSRFLVLFILAGSSAGAIVTRGILFKIYFISITLQLTPVAITYALIESPVSSVILALTVVFYFFMLFVARNYSESIRDNIQLRLDLEHEMEVRESTEIELRQAKQVAEAANKTKNHFLASISHELRTPLNGIIGFTTALRETKLDLPQKEYASHIGNCSNTLLHMVSDVLDITTIEAGKMKLRHYPFNLSQEMEEVTGLAKQLAEGKGLRFDCTIATELPRHLIGDGQRLKQIVNNLVSNAIKYTDEGYVRLGIEPVSLEGDRASLLFTIEDSGIGIPQEAQSTLFDSFTQANNNPNKHYDGVGLGLSIVSNLLQAMEGRIGVESEVGKGTRFKVCLPFERNLNPPQQEETSNRAVTPKEGDLSQMRVLIVDDNHINRLVLKTFLEPYSVSYSEASSGNEALQLLHDDNFNLVLIDINMPDLSGVEVREQYFRDNDDGPAFVAVTAHAMESEISGIIHSGFDDCLIKPVAVDDLIGVVKRFST